MFIYSFTKKVNTHLKSQEDGTYLLMTTSFKVFSSKLHHISSDRQMGITTAWWNSLHDWGVAVARYKLLQRRAWDAEWGRIYPEKFCSPHPWRFSQTE